MQKFVGILLVLMCLGLIGRCHENKEKQSDTTKTELMDLYKGNWHLVEAKDSAMQHLLDLGLVAEFHIYTDRHFEIWTIVGTERTKQNSGTLYEVAGKDYFETSLPDQEYGGTIKGTLKLRGGKLIYQTGSVGDWIFERY